MNLTPQELLAGSLELASLPEVFTRVNDMLDDPHSSASDIGKVISDDPALTTRLLKIVNSAFYSFPSQIGTVSRAITIIGTRELRDLILATSVVKLFNHIPEDLITMDSFWRHSISVGLIAQSMASQRHDENIEPVFVAGLIHDIGRLVICSKVPEIEREALARAKFNGMDLTQSERTVLGFDHTQVGAELARLWLLPNNLYEAMAFHHTPQYAESHVVETAIVHLANDIANAVDLGNGVQVHADMPTDSPLWRTTGLPPDTIETVLAEAEKRFQETLQLILYEDAA